MLLKFAIQRSFCEGELCFAQKHFYIVKFFKRSIFLKEFYKECINNTINTLIQEHFKKFI